MVILAAVIVIVLIVLMSRCACRACSAPDDTSEDAPEKPKAWNEALSERELTSVAQRMQREGRMPSLGRLLAALRRSRARQSDLPLPPNTEKEDTEQEGESAEDDWPSAFCFCPYPCGAARPAAARSRWSAFSCSTLR